MTTPKRLSKEFWRGYMATLIAMYGGKTSVRYVIMYRKLRFQLKGW